MSDIPVDGMTRVVWMPNCGNVAGPTVAELTAGMLLTYRLTSDGLIGFDPTTAKIDAASLGDTFDLVDTGTDSFGDNGFRLKRQKPLNTDIVYTTLIKGLAGFVGIRRDVDRDTAWIAGQLLEVYPAKCGRRKRLMPERNTMTRYEVPIFITSQPELDAVVAA